MGILPMRYRLRLNNANMPTRPTARLFLVLAVILTGSIVAFVATRDNHATAQPKAIATAPAQEQSGPTNPDVQTLIDHATSGRGAKTEHDASRLPSDLAAADFRRLLAFSIGKRPEKLDSPSWDVVVNDIWNALRRQKSYPPEFAAELIAYFRAPATTDVLKDYAIQHLGSWISADLSADEGETDLAVRKQILAFLAEATRLRDKSYAGTALYALDRAILKGGAAEEANPALAPIKASFVAPLQDAALALLRDSNASTLARISAFQIALERQDARALALSRQIATDASAPPMLRASAIACLGRIGAPSDIDVLAPIARNCTDTRLLGALKPAMENLSKPQAPAGS